MNHLAQKLERGETTLPQLLFHWARVHPTALAFRKKHLGIWSTWTWQEYADAVRNFALGLRALGFQSGDRFAIAGEGCPEWLVADIAAQALGGTCVGLYPTSPWQEISYVLSHASARIVVCGDQEQVDKVLEARRAGCLPALERVIFIDGKGMRSYSDPILLAFDAVVRQGAQLNGSFGPEQLEQLVEEASPDATAILVYTSGTTGKPKGARLSHRNLVVSAWGVLATFGYSAKNHEVVCYLPLCHVAERSFSTVMQLCCGSVVSFAESVNTVLADVREIAPTMFLGVPRIWEKLQQTITIKIKESYPVQRLVYALALRLATAIAKRAIDNGGRLANLADRLAFAILDVVLLRNLRRFTGLHRARACICGAAAISPEVILYFRAIGLPVYQAYGMTETAAVAFQQQPGWTRFGCVGVPIPSISYRLGPDSELFMRGPSVFQGYLDDPDATSAAFEDGWLRSGDIARPVGDEVQIVDRKKDIIITSGGKNISPSEIENALKESEFIREAIVVGEGRSFLSALLQVDYDAVAHWAQEQQLSFTTYRGLVELPQVRELIEREVRRGNARFARVSQVRNFVLLAKELDHDDGELTATMKVRRKAVETKFSAEIAQLYGASA